MKFDQYQVVSNPKIALNTAKKINQNIIVTGSLYLLPKVYTLLSN